jgi:hypothetical protein
VAALKTVSPNFAFELLHTTGTSANSFTYPLASGSGANASAQYQFQHVIQFDPQGAARVLMAGQTGTVDTDSVPYCIEVCLQQAHGNVPTALPTNGPGDLIALQVDGMTGNVRVFRP